MNKKLIVAYVAVALITAFATYGTVAYFSDKETSKNNIISAGDVDLKIDHTLSYYNDLFCDDQNTLQEQCTMGNLVKNGSFENPEVTNSAKWDVFPSGTPGLDWTVAWVAPTATPINGQNRPSPALREYQEGVNGWTAQQGDQWIELDSDWFGPQSNINGEPALIKISQDIQTIPGRTYNVSFWYNKRPDANASESTMNFSFGTLSAAISATGGWTQYTNTFVATGYVTKLMFEGTGANNSLGIFLDNVSITATNCSTTNVLVGHSCARTFSEKDLAEGDKFFNFDDVKPGDFGRSIISMHVLDNESWACLNIKNHKDEENGVKEPEGTDTDATGELSKYITMFLWRDNNDNGIFEPALGETQLKNDTLKNLAMIALYDSTTGAGNIIPGEVKFIGMAWCAGTISADTTTGAFSCDQSTMENDSMSDKFSADLEIYTTQKRHNDSFKCSDLNQEISGNFDESDYYPGDDGDLSV